MHDGMEIEFSPVIVNASQLEHGQTYLRISDARFVHESYGRDRWTVNLSARHHPRSERYDVPAAVRAVVHAFERPRSVVCGFSALALYGLPYLVEGADTTLRAPMGRCSPASAFALGRSWPHPRGLRPRQYSRYAGANTPGNQSRCRACKLTS